MSGGGLLQGMPRWRPGQFPAGPPDSYNPDDPYADPVALSEFREYAAREKKVRVEKAKVCRMLSTLTPQLTWMPLPLRVGFQHFCRIALAIVLVEPQSINEVVAFILLSFVFVKPLLRHPRRPKGLA